MSFNEVALGDLVTQLKSTWKPTTQPNAQVKHYSIPAFDKGAYEIVNASEIASNKFLIPPASILYSKLNPARPRIWRVDSVSEIESVTSTEFLVLVPKKHEDIFYIEAVLNSPHFTEVASSLVNGTSGSHQRIQPKDVLAIKIPWPESEKYRRLIGEQFLSISEKILVNKRIADILENISQTIFRSWFVDFDPVHAKARGEHPIGMDAETAALFPDSFEDSDLGPIPYGWQMSALSEFTQVPIGGLWGSDEESESADFKYLCLRGTDMDDLKSNAIASRIPLRWNKKANVDKRQLSNCDVLIGGSGAGPVGKSMLWDSTIGDMFQEEVIFSNFVKRFKTENESLATFLWQKLDLMHQSGEIFTFVNGTSVPNLQDTDLLSATRVAMPPIEILTKQNDYVRNFIRMKFTGENATLERLRDSLLPRLISGELEIPAELLEA
jgi:type I restriction enzyme S subunit